MNMMFSSVMLAGMCLASCAWANAGAEGAADAVPLNVSVLYTTPPAAARPQGGPFTLPNMPAMPTGFGDVQQAISGMRDSISNFENLSFNNAITDVAAAYMEYVRNAVAANVANATQNQDEMIVDFFEQNTLVVQDFLDNQPTMLTEGWLFGAINTNVVIVLPTGGFFAP